MQQRSKRKTAALLAFAFGGVGVYKYYLGKYVQGTILLLLTLVGFASAAWLFFMLMVIQFPVDLESLDGDALVDSIEKMIVYLCLGVFAASATSIWAFIEAILFICMTDENFEKRVMGVSESPHNSTSPGLETKNN